MNERLSLVLGNNFLVNSSCSECSLPSTLLARHFDFYVSFVYTAIFSVQNVDNREEMQNKKTHQKPFDFEKTVRFFIVLSITTSVDTERRKGENGSLQQ